MKNEFADAVEETEPKFAAWMRRHGKQAVLKDDEVDRCGWDKQRQFFCTREVVRINKEM